MFNHLNLKQGKEKKHFNPFQLAWIKTKKANSKRDQLQQQEIKY